MIVDHEYMTFKLTFIYQDTISKLLLWEPVQHLFYSTGLMEFIIEHLSSSLTPCRSEIAGVLHKISPSLGPGESYEGDAK